MIAQNHYHHHHHQPAPQQLLHQLSLWLGLAAAVRIKQSFCLCFIICSGLQVTVVNLPQVTTLQHQLHQQLKIKAQLVLQVFLLGPQHGKYPPPWLEDIGSKEVGDGFPTCPPAVYFTSLLLARVLTQPSPHGETQRLKSISYQENSFTSSPVQHQMCPDSEQEPDPGAKLMQ